MHRATPGPAAIVAALVATLLMTTIGPAAASAPTSSAAVNVVRIDGRGHGHGVGLSQWGAYTMARDGMAAADILATFYPGTQIGTAGGEVVVAVDQRARMHVRLPQGGEIRSARDGAQAEGFPIPVGPGEVVEVVHDGSGYRVVRQGGVRGVAATSPQRYQVAGDDCVVLCAPDQPGDQPDDGSDGDSNGGSDQGADDGPCVVCTTTTTQPDRQPDDEPDDPATPVPSPTDGPDDDPGAGPGADPAPAAGAPHSPTPVWAVPNGGGTVEVVDRGRAYRGAMELTGGPGALRARNHVDIEDYLRGMAEVPGHWPAAAVQAQTVAARTYALRAMAASGEICDSDRCQVYTGVSHESAGQSAAVEATRGWVVTYGGHLAATFYSASGGGHSATVAEGFGSDYDVPYLQAHPYATSNPKEWHLDISLSDVAGRLGYPGTVTAVQVLATGPSGRPTRMVLDGDAGTREVDPQDFRRRLGLQSTLFTVATTVTDTAPPPPPPPSEGDQLTDASASGDDQVPTLLTEELDLAAPRAAPLHPVLQTAGATSGVPTTPVLAAAVLLVATALALALHLGGTHHLRLAGARATGTRVIATLGAGAVAAIGRPAAKLWRWNAGRRSPRRRRSDAD